jgi:hypothetical protein
MLRGMRRVVLSVLAMTALACGGSVGGDASGDGGLSGSGGLIGVGGGGTGGGFGGFAAYGGTGGGSGGFATGGTGGYIDPGCPDAAPPPKIEECQPFANPTGCEPGEGCYPFVQYPQQKCDKEQFGTICAPAGSGKQGEPCGGDLCAAGFVCVVTGVGTQCVKMCKLDGPSSCPPGLFCVPVDVEGIGGCF